MRQSIKQQVMIRIALIFCIVIISGIVTIIGMRRVRECNKSTEQATDINSLVLTAEKAHYGWVENLCSSIAMGTEFTGTADYKTCVLGKWFYGSDESIPKDAEILRLVEEMKPIHQSMHESAQAILELNTTEPEQAQQMYLDTTKKSVEKLVALLSQVADITEQQMAQNRTKLEGWVFWSEMISVAAIVAILIASVLFVLYVFKEIVNPVEVITKSSKNLSEGKLDFQIDIKNNSEIGILAESLNTSVRNLKFYISDIARILQEMASGNLASKTEVEYIGDFAKIQQAIDTISQEQSNIMEQIQVSASQVDSGSEQVAQGAQNLAQGSTEQASEVDNLLHMIEQITEQINGNAESASITTAEADHMKKEIDVCNQEMKDMAEAMVQINSCSGEIQHIIKTIDDIASQTNILALNAAVEAARAGSAGKGFAVVADEVRSLAAKSADAVKETTELIDRTLNMVAAGSTLTDITQESLASVVEGAQKVTSQIKVISEVSKEQESAINHIKDSIHQISSVIQSNSAASEESAAASQELSGQAQVLKSLTGRFQLRK